MSFVDELRKPSPPRKSPEQIKFEKQTEKMHEAIKAYCRKHKEQKRAAGYLMYSADREYSQEWFDAFSDLLIPFSSELSADERIGAERIREKKSQRSAYVETQGCHDYTKPVAEEKTACDRYIPALIKKLQADGFENIKIETVTCYEIYDVITRKSGFINNSYSKERVKTNKIWGYTIKFSVSW